MSEKLNLKGFVSNVGLNQETDKYLIGVSLEVTKEQYITILEKTQEDRSLELNI